MEKNRLEFGSWAKFERFGFNHHSMNEMPVNDFALAVLSSVCFQDFGESQTLLLSIHETGRWQMKKKRKAP